MQSRTTKEFWKLFQLLPESVQQQARKAYELFQHNPNHPSLNFKPVANQVYSVRISQKYRVLGRIEEDGVIVWFWIGDHEGYDKILKTL